MFSIKPSTAELVTRTEVWSAYKTEAAMILKLTVEEHVNQWGVLIDNYYPFLIVIWMRL